MDISKELRLKVNEAMNAVPDLVAELAVDYFKERFRYKSSMERNGRDPDGDINAPTVRCWWIADTC